MQLRLGTDSFSTGDSACFPRESLAGAGGDSLRRKKRHVQMANVIPLGLA
jgi:hypothetical protein